MADCAYVEFDGERCRMWTCVVDEYCTKHKRAIEQVVVAYWHVVDYFRRKHGV